MFVHVERIGDVCSYLEGHRPNVACMSAAEYQGACPAWHARVATEWHDACPTWHARAAGERHARELQSIRASPRHGMQEWRESGMQEWLQSGMHERCRVSGRLPSAACKSGWRVDCKSG
eukprot:1157012-Pelagomonas_calceolata.AAC.7